MRLFKGQKGGRGRFAVLGYVYLKRTSMTRRREDMSLLSDDVLLGSYDQVRGVDVGELGKITQKDVRLKGWKRNGTVFFLCLLTAFLFADQNIMAPNLTQIGKEFGFTAKERDQKLGGEISFAFFLMGGPVSLLVGYLTDLIPRKPLFVMLILLGEVPALLTIFVKEFWELLVLRTLTGIAIGGAMPIIYSMLGDIFTARERAMVSALISLSLGIGVTIGQLLAGFVGPAYGWRLPFVIVALPAISTALLSLVFIEEPERGCTEEGLLRLYEEDSEKGGSGAYHYRERITAGKACGIFAVPTNCLVFLQGIPGCLPWSVIMVFLNDYLTQEKGLSVERSTVVLSCLNIGGCIGSLLGGHFGQLLYNWRRSWIVLLMGGSTFVGIIPIAWLLNLDSPLPPLYQICIAAALGGGIASFTGPNTRAVLLNVNAPETRGTAFAIYNLMDHLGTGLGPGVLAVMITLSSSSRVATFTAAVVLGWAMCGSIWLSMGLVLVRDEDRLQKRLEAGHGPVTCCFQDS